MDKQAQRRLITALAVSALFAVLLLVALNAWMKSSPLPLPLPGPEKGKAGAPQAAQPAPSPAPSGRIEILVRDSREQPLAGAKVTLWAAYHSSLHETESSQAGSAVFEAIPAGDYLVGAQAADLILHDREELTVTTGKTTRTVIVLEQGLALSGTIFSGGKPVAAACVSLYADGKAATFECGETGADGRFSFSPLGPGRYSLTSSLAGHKTERIPRIKLARDQAAPSIAIELKKLTAVKGAVLAGDGAPVEGASLTVRQAESSKKQGPSLISLQDVDLPQPADHPRLISSGHLGILKGPIPDFPYAEESAAAPEGRAADSLPGCGCMKQEAADRTAVSDVSGAFRLSVDADMPFDLTVSHPDYAPQKLLGLKPLAAGGKGEGGLVIELDRGRDVHGRITTPDGRLPENPILWLEMGEFNIVSDIPVAGDGTFLISHAAGALVLNVTAPGFAHERKKVTAEKIGPGEIITITLMPDEEIMTGRVVDRRGFPVEGASVLVEPAGGEEDGARREARSDSDGIFSFVTLRPGGWTISIDHSSYFTLRRTVEAWGEEEEFSLLYPGGIAGSVTDDLTYLPVDTFTLTLRSGESLEKSEDFSGGSFAWPDLPAGPCLLEIEAPGYVGRTMDITVPPAEDKLEITLESVDFWLMPADQ
ncbi:MAG: carboxypeptidase regulatory-like domain-containing protein [Pseudomonadota bacterium]